MINTSACPPKHQPIPNEVPTQIGDYRVEHVLGQGGMGIVYAAAHERTGTRAALKTVVSVSSANVAQLRREIFTLAHLRHPGVVRILDHGISNGMPWYAMELIDGATLKDVFAAWWAGQALVMPYVHCASSVRPENDRTPAPTVTGVVRSDVQATLPIACGDYPLVVCDSEPRTVRRRPAAGGNLSEALALIRDVCDVLAFLHGEGVIHRDLKPSNVFVRDNGQPVLADFGLADELGGRAGREVLGRSDSVMGSFPYMSPEQIEGEVLDARCDLYSVGCLLYTAVTGHPPFLGTIERIASAHLHELPLPASSWVTGVPEDLDELIGALLIKDPRRRFGYAEDVAAALDCLGAKPRSWQSELPAHRAYLYRPPFVGRREPFEKLAKRLRGVFSADGGLVFVGGESGVGKTRLALEAANCARDCGVMVVTGICATVATAVGDPSVQDQPLRPVGALLEAVADRWLEADAEERERLLGGRAALVAPYSAAVAALPGVDQLPKPPPLPVELAKERLYDAVSTTLRALGNLCPVVVILEDLQWADELTLGLLEYLARRKPKGLRGVIVGTYRSDECSERLRALVGSGMVEHYLVPRMSDEEVGQMTSGMLNCPPEGLVSFLANHSAGNPFFVAEYLRSALHSGALVRTPTGGWRVAETDAWAPPYESLPLPQALQQVVELRLRRLRESTRGVLETAAVMGRRIDIPALKLATELDEERLLDVLDETERAFVWEVGPDGAYRFAHDKLRELPLAELDGDRRRFLHGLVAEAIERAYAASDELKAHHAAIGHHWAAANEPARAAPHLLAGGDAARDAHAIDEAIRLYDAARQQLDQTDPVDRGPELQAVALTIDEKLGDVLSFRGHHDRARQAFERALGSAHEDDVTLRVRILRKVAKTWEVQHEHGRARRTYEDALAIVPTEPGERDAELAHEWVQIVLGRAWIFYWQGRPQEMSIEIARVAPHVEARGTLLQRYQYYLAVVTRDYRQHRYRVSNPTLQAGRACVAAAREAGALPEIAFGRFVLGFALLFRGELMEAEAEVSAALDACRQLGDAVGETRAIAYAALLHRLQGRVAETEQVARETLGLAEVRGMGDYIGMAQACLGWVALRRGERGEAEHLSRTALATWSRLSFPYPFRWCGALILMKLLLVPGSDPDARKAIVLAEELTKETQHQLPDALDEPLQAAVRGEATGNLTEARRQVERALAAAEDLGFV
ncbi:MAG: protein kinase [Polyangiaceae bacterium]|nr:protein kinase [Polyangiaceae bacterium]